MGEMATILRGPTITMTQDYKTMQNNNQYKQQPSTYIFIHRVSHEILGYIWHHKAPLY